MCEIKQKGKLAKTASFALTTATTEEKNAALEAISEQLLQDQKTILEANQKDLEQGKANGLTEAVLDRIMLDENRIKAMAKDRKSTRLNSSHVSISYAVFCLKKKTTKSTNDHIAEQAQRLKDIMGATGGVDAEEAADAHHTQESGGAGATPAASAHPHAH